MTVLSGLTIIYFEIRSLFIILIKNLKGKIRDFQNIKVNRKFCCKASPLRKRRRLDFSISGKEYA